MAFPTYDTIRTYYLNGKWTDAMLKTAVVCKAITSEQYAALVAEKKGS